MQTSGLPTAETDSAKRSVKGVSENRTNWKRELSVWALCAISGAVLGLSAPGYDRWYLVWFGLVPLLLASQLSRNVAVAFWRGMVFGTAYNLVYVAWDLQFSRLVWPEGIQHMTHAMNALVWVLVSLQQGALIGAFSAIARWLPLKGGFSPAVIGGRWRLPAFFVLPLLWVLILNKLGNLPGTMGVPWSMLEYSQYEQLPLIQLASITGGIGIGALIVLVNVALCSLLAAGRQGARWKTLQTGSITGLLASILVVGLIVFGGVEYGKSRLENRVAGVEKKGEPVSVLQGNILFGLNEVDPSKHLLRYMSLADDAPSGLCIWPEWSMPISVRKFPKFLSVLKFQAREFNQDWIVGVLDSDNSGRTYNAACALSRRDEEENPVYHKKFLVPFLEYSPAWIFKSPFGLLCGTLTPSRSGYITGDSTVVFKLGGKLVCPLICCELILPELACEGVRKGAELLVDCSNTMWFESDLVGRQCIAMCVFRAVENKRDFVFATSTGPSAFIDAYGRILKTAPRDTACSLVGHVGYQSDVTLFTRWFR